MRFFFGLHHPYDARKFGSAFVSVNALAGKKSMRVTDWIMDSGAFTEISRHGHYRASVAEYADKIAYWSTHTNGKLHAAVSQDYMCEPMILARTGLTIDEHQRLTIERYDALVRELRERGCDAYVMPVLQGYAPDDYVRHLAMYGDRLAPDAWVGVGSVCKRNDDIGAIVAVLGAISDAAPGLRLHGFGLKTNALRAPVVRALLYTADSMAWSFQARVQGRDANDSNEAAHWAQGFGVNREGITRETWRTIGVNESDCWQTDPPADWKPAPRKSRTKEV